MIRNELRFAARTFIREPWFAAGVIANLALAIGAATAMFGLANRLLFAPPPGIADPDRVARVGLMRAEGTGAAPFTFFTTSYPAFAAVAEGEDGVEAAAFRPDTATLGRGADTELVSVVAATGNWFATLGVRRAVAGRLFGPGDDLAPSGNDVVVLGHAFWQRRFGGGTVVGTELVIDGMPLTVIGVAPPGFNGAGLSRIDVYVPIHTAMRRQPGWSANVGMNVVSIVARLRDGVDRMAITERLTRRVRDATMRYPGEPTVSVSLQPLEGATGAAQARIVLASLGVSLAVLLIATANAGTLLLLRATRRRGETAVRVALGASGWALARHSLMESGLLAMAGGMAGLVLARWAGDAVRIALLPGLAPDESLVDGRVVAVAILMALGTGIVAGLAPFGQWRHHVAATELRAGGTGSSVRSRTQRLLVGVQVSLCTALLVGAGLFSQSMRRAQAQDLGFSTARLLYVSIGFLGALSGPARDQAYHDAVDRVRTLPGVQNASVTQGMPFASHHIPPVSIPGYELPPPDVQQLPIMYAATPEYLGMMGVTLREGRRFTAQDTRGAPLVVLVNETMAKTIWPGRSAIGRCIRAGMGDPGLGDPMSAAAFLPCREVVGVVKDSRARSLRTEGDEARLMQYYVPFEQVPAMPGANAPQVHAMLVSVSGDPAGMVGPVQRLIQRTSAVPVHARVRPYQDLLDPQLRQWRMGTRLFSMAGFLALTIAAVGLFAVISYLVTQRTPELGVRVALGASGTGIARLVIRDAIVMAGAGTGAGLVVALAAAPVFRTLLFETSPRDPVTYIVAAALVMGVAAGAALLPARRASRVPPMTALRP